MDNNNFIELTRDQIMAFQILNMSNYGSFGSQIEGCYDGCSPVKTEETNEILNYILEERLLYKKFRNKFFAETFFHYNKDKINEINKEEN